MSTFNGFANSLMLITEELDALGVDNENFKVVTEVIRGGADEITRLQAQLDEAQDERDGAVEFIREQGWTWTYMPKDTQDQG
jgi:hypothetical protein